MSGQGEGRDGGQGEGRDGGQREVIHVEGLGMRYGGVVALMDVTLTLKGPQVIGILGPNGAGKTTFIEILEGLRQPTSGTIRLFGEPLLPRRYPHRRIGAVLQREPVLDGVTVREYAELFAALYGVPGGGPMILESAALGQRAQVAVDRLSGGEAQRLFLAAAVVHRPELLFLDEPTAHLDPENRARIVEQVRLLGQGCTVLLCTHNLEEADRICDTVVFLVGGRIKAAGPRAVLIDSVPEVPEAKGGRHRGKVDRSRNRLEDAFFHYCAAALTPQGELL